MIGYADFAVSQTFDVDDPKLSQTMEYLRWKVVCFYSPQLSTGTLNTFGTKPAKWII